MISWIVWLIFADKKRWRELFPVSILAGFAGALSDVLMEKSKLWMYYTKGNEEAGIIETLDDLGIYVVVTYLFIQWLPKKETFWKMFGYWLIWTTIVIVIEWIYVQTGHMKHHSWWTFWHSYIADWFLFLFFYMYYKTFNLEIQSPYVNKRRVKSLPKINNAFEVIPFLLKKFFRSK
ncbi:CBO0543 family protein [Ammoniphilus sp. 3BR4]|uniref:CBO0543 family protein n=1 Tax=Ammoniphilus sp. 3BR4 TaxID=3158265 RepID=UPI003467A817